VPLDSIQEDSELDHYEQIPAKFKELWKREPVDDFDSTSYLWHLIEQVQREWQDATLQNPNKFGFGEPPQSQAKSELLSRFWDAITDCRHGERFARQLLEVHHRPYVMLYGERFEYNAKNIVRFVYFEMVRTEPERIVTYPMLEQAVWQWRSQHALFQNGQQLPLSLPDNFLRLVREIGLGSLPEFPKRGHPRKA